VNKRRAVSARGPEPPRPAPAAKPAGGQHPPVRGVLISGGDRGIGAAAARAFYEAGYRVAVLYHTNAEAAAALEASLPGIIALQCDVASRAACESAFTAAEIMLGHVDVLVCNAGIAQQKLFTDITPAEWQHMLDVNLTGAFHLCQLALPGMIRRKWGRILTVSSMWGQTGGSCEVHYSAAKAGLIGMTKALAREEGEIQFTDYGLSGICVMQLSGLLAPGRGPQEPAVTVDLFPAWTEEDLAALLEQRAKRLAAFPGCWQGMLDRRLGDALWAAAGLSGRKPAQLGPEDWRKLAHTCKAWRFSGLSLCGWKQAQTTGGGLSLEEVEPDFQFKGCRGLYFVGETLDCAGSCGGFNLHWAFGSGVVAGRAAATTR